MNLYNKRNIDTDLKFLEYCMKNKKIYVLLKNKIVGIDSVIPLCLELNKVCGCRFTFVLFNHPTFQAITNDNIVLFDAINSIGELVDLSVSSNRHVSLEKITTVFFLIKMMYCVNYRRNYIMHFGALHEYPLDKMVKLINLSRVILCENTSYGPCSTVSNIYNYRETQIEYSESHLHKSSILNARILIGYDKLWNYFKHDKAVNAHKVLFNNSRNSNAWIDFIKSKSSSYIDNELHNAFDNQGHGHIIIVFIGRLNLDETGKYVSSFIQLIHELAKNIGDKFPVFIKPHIFSDLDFLEKCILEGIGNYTMNYIITKLHPSVLASRAAIALFVNNSTVIHEISNLNVPIIQCLYGFNRDEALNESSNKSNYVMTKGMDNLSVIVNKLLSVNASPIVYRKKQEKIDCSFLLH